MIVANKQRSDLVYPACSWLQVCWTSKVISWADPPGLDGVLPGVEELTGAARQQRYFTCHHMDSLCF